MRLNRSHKQIIVDTVMGEIAEAFKPIQSDVNTIVEDYYRLVVSEEDQLACESIDPRLVHMKRGVSIPDLYYDPVHRFTIYPRDIIISTNFSADNSDLRPYPKDYYNLDLDEYPELKARVMDVHERYIKFVDNYIEVKTELIKVLSRVRTTDKLLEVWPEAKQYIDKLTPPVAKADPKQVDASALRKALIKKC